MRAHSLPLTRRGVRLFHWGLQLLAGVVIINLLSFLAGRFPWGAVVAKTAGTVTPWLQIAASLAMPAVLVMALWGLVMLVRFARKVWAVDRAFTQTTRDAAESGPAWGHIPAERLAAGSLAAGILALGGFVANQWAETTLAGDWTARRLRELVDTAAAGAAPGPSVGRVAPAMAMQTIDGETIRLTDYAGRVVVLNFWATWCPPCVAEIPDLARLAREIEGEGGIVIGISMEDPGALS